MSNFHRSLLNFFDTVIITDCDELLVPDPEAFADLREYISGTDFDYVNSIGIDVLHIMNEEGPLDLFSPILSQRHYGRFHSPVCKALISRVPMTWLPGFHSSDKPPNIDTKLYIFHTKVMDYNLAMGRQQINLTTTWSDDSLVRNYGAHWRFDYQTFVHMNFLAPMDIIKRGLVHEFEFGVEVAQIRELTVADKGFFRIPMNISKMVRIPERFQKLL
jgi:hypothetical protein